MGNAALRAFTLEDYWAVELESPLRHEYFDGVIYAMAGGKPRHNEVAANVQYALRRGLEGTPWRPIGADQRLKVADGKYTYADLSVFCGRIEVAPGPPPDTATNPVLVVEVLSDATRTYDLGDKREKYQAVASVDEIWLIEPERTWVKVLRRTSGGWTEDVYEDPGAALTYRGAAVALADVYAKTVT